MSGLISPWVPTTDPQDFKVLGKQKEELGELTAATSRCVIQGINESEPVTLKPNLLWLTEEVADVQATSELLIEHFGLNRDFIAKRKAKKLDGFYKWLDMMPLN